MSFLRLISLGRLWRTRCRGAGTGVLSVGRGGDSRPRADGRWRVARCQSALGERLNFGPKEAESMKSLISGMADQGGGRPVKFLWVWPGSIEHGITLRFLLLLNSTSAGTGGKPRNSRASECQWGPPGRGICIWLCLWAETSCCVTRDERRRCVTSNHVMLRNSGQRHTT